MRSRPGVGNQLVHCGALDTVPVLGGYDDQKINTPNQAETSLSDPGEEQKWRT